MTYLNKSIIYMYIIFCFFPWVRFGTDGDMQPFALLMGLFLVLNMVINGFRLSLPINLVPIYFLPIVSLIVIVAYGIYDKYAIRGFATTLGILIHILIWNKLIHFNGLAKVVRISSLVYAIVGFIELVYGSSFLSFFTPTRTSIGRGVTSLTPEPSAFATISVLLLLIEVMLFKLKNEKTIISFWPSIFSIIFLAQSFIGVFLLIILFLAILKIKNLFYFLIISILLFFLYEVISNGGGRFLNLLSILLDKGFLALLLDESANDRARSIVFPIYGSYEINFMPGGYHSFGLTSEKLRNIFPIFDSGHDVNIIMSGLGSMIYELGVFSLLLLFPIVLTFLSSDFPIFYRFRYLTFFLLVFITAIPLSLPLFSILIIFYTKIHDLR